MKHRIEKPITKIVSAVLTALLVFNLIPVGSFSVRAEGEEPLVIASYQLVSKDPAQGVYALSSIGSFELTSVDNPEEKITGQVINGRMEVTNFTDGAAYTLRMSLPGGTGWFYVPAQDAYFRAPADGVTLTISNGTEGNILCDRIPNIEYTGLVQSDEGNAVDQATVTLSAVGNLTLAQPKSVTTGPDGRFQIAFADLPGETISLTVSKDGYYSSTVSKFPTEGHDFGTIVIPRVRPDTSVPVISVPQDDSRFDYYQENGYGRAGVTQARIQLTEGVPGQYEQVGGLKYLYVSCGDYGSFEHTAANVTPIEISGINYVYTGDVSTQNVYVYYVVDAAGNVSEPYRVTYRNDNEPPKFANAGLYSNEECTDSSGISVKTDGYHSDNTVYLKFDAMDDGGSEVYHAAFYIKDPNSAEYTFYASVFPQNNGSFVVPFTAEAFAQFKEIGINIYDKAGNGTELLTLTAMGLQKNCVAIGSLGPVVTVNVEGTGVSPLQGDSASVFKDPPKYTFTFTDPMDGGIAELTATVNGTAVYQGDNGLVIDGETVFASGTQLVIQYPKDAEGNDLLHDGQNVLVVSCRNPYGATTTKTYSFTLDHAAPSVSNISIAPYADGTTVGTVNGEVYATGAVLVTVTAADGETAAGLASVTLLNDGTEYETKAVSEGNAVSFLIPAEYSPEMNYTMNISFIARDQLGNVSAEIVPDEQNSNAGSGKIHISASKTEMSIEVAPGTVIGEKEWYTAAPTATITARDTFSGIKKIVVGVNGLSVNGSPFEFTDSPLPSEKAIEIPIPAMYAGNDGICEIVVAVENGAGTTSFIQKTIYIDETEPGLNAFTLTPSEGAMNSLPHGTYISGAFTVTVEALDQRVGTESIVLLADGTEIGRASVSEDGKTATFVVSEDNFSQELTRHSISAYAIDRLGKTGTAVLLSADNSNANSGEIVFDAGAPTALATVEGTPESRTTGDGETVKVWYSSDIVWNVSLMDLESGIGSCSVSLNGTILTADADGNELVTDYTQFPQIVETQAFRISASQAASNEDCSYELIVSVTDNAGNVSEVCRQVVYIDGDKPEVTLISVSSQDSNGSIGVLPYDVYANGPVVVTVTATDFFNGPGAGVEKINLYIDGVLFAEGTPAEGTGTCMFVIPAETLPEGFTQTFQLSAQAVDASGLIGDLTAPTAENSNLANGTITLENVAPLVEMILPEVGRKVLDDFEEWYGDDFSFIIRFKDEQSGLDSLDLTINGVPVTVDGDGTDIPSSFLAESAVTASPEFRFDTSDYTNEKDEFVITVSLTDAAGNRTEFEKTLRIDRKKPVINGFDVTPENEADTLHYLQFGTFANGRVSITVTVSDEAPASGADKVILYVNGSTDGIVADVTDGRAVFVIPTDVITEEFCNGYTFSAVAVDRYGNIGEIVPLDSSVIPQMAGNRICVENIAPSIFASKDGTPGKTANGQQWHLSDVKWNVQITDEQSGIAMVSVKLNGQTISKDLDGKDISADYRSGSEAVSVLNFVFSSSQVTITDENSVTIEITAKDNAGNESFVYTDKIYKDTTNPVIKGFRFQPLGGTETGLIGPGTVISDSGFFFGKDTVVRISAEDPNNGSGIMSISYYLKNADGTETSVQTVAADSNGDVFIKLPTPFRGEIYAKAIDQLSNASEYASVKGIIIETPESHNTETHITLTKPQATGVQSNGTELYNANVELNLRIADHYSGIKAVEWSVTAPYDQARNQAGTLTVSDNGALNGDGGWTVVSTDGKMVTELTKAIVVSNDSNDITVRIRMRDAAGNVSERQMTFGIDKTVPTVEYSFDNTTPDSDYSNIYNQSRTMTIVVTERNFVPGDFTFSARNTDGSAPAIGRWTEETDPNDPNKTIHTTTVSFFSDGNYSIGLSYSDRAGNRAGIAAVPSFIIDRTRPIINVSFDNNDAKNGNYYNTERTATVTVVERNFDVSRVQLDGNAQKTGIWTANGDQHSITLTFSKDGSYSFTVSASDRAGNTTEAYTSETFIIDTTAPELTLEGFDRANGGEVAPIITCMDDNFDPAGVNINLTRISNKEVHVRYTTSEIVDEERTGMRWTYANIDPEQENDDLYTFRISATDKAGNACETIIKSFSVNRYGSTYDLNSIENLNGKYSSVTEDLVIYEYNVDEIDTDEVTVELLRNNEHHNLVRGKDYAVETVIEKDQEFNKYKYVIRKEVFAQDGEYSIQIVSQDKAGNVNQNTEKGAESRIAFCIDKIEPDIIVIEPVSGGSYAQPSLTATVLIRDNYKLDKVHFILDGVELQANVSGDTFTIEIPESDSKQTLEIYATDAAGNVARTEIKDILVTSSMFIRFIHNTAALVTTIILLLLLLALAVFMVIHRRRSKA